MYLAIDTSTKYAGVALWATGNVLRRTTWHSMYSHTAELMPAIQELLRGAGVAVSALKGIAVATGPGGFSTLRAGLSVAKGLAFPLSLPVVGVSTLEASAYPHRNAGQIICSMVESGRTLVAWARFQSKHGVLRRLTPDRVTEAPALLAFTGRHTLFCGEGAVAYRDQLEGALGHRAHFIEEADPSSRLFGLVELGAARLAAGESDPLAGLQPHYLRAPTTSTPRPPRFVKQGGTAKPR
jgi:tRNA threonylcarbamoyladenosine biosynthesis protein TsaB